MMLRKYHFKLTPKIGLELEKVILLTLFLTL